MIEHPGQHFEYYLDYLDAYEIEKLKWEEIWPIATELYDDEGGIGSQAFGRYYHYMDARPIHVWMEAARGQTYEGDVTPYNPLGLQYVKLECSLPDDGLALRAGIIALAEADDISKDLLNNRKRADLSAWKTRTFEFWPGPAMEGVCSDAVGYDLRDTEGNVLWTTRVDADVEDLSLPGKTEIWLRGLRVPTVTYEDRDLIGFSLAKLREEHHLNN
jgi:hypothetical protein